MIYQLIQFFALFLLMLVTGIFWGPWFSLHRSLNVFNAREFIHIVKIMAANLAVPMRILMPTCIFFMFLSAFFCPQKNTPEFYLFLTAFGLTLVSLVITLLVEVPIVTSINTWTERSIPGNWNSIRDRWVRFHVIRTFTSLASFAAFIAAIILAA